MGRGTNSGSGTTPSVGLGQSGSGGDSGGKGDGTGVTRPIYVECHPDRLVIVPDPGTDGKPQVFPLSGALRGALDPFVAGLRKHMESWGLALAGGYWKPVLKVKVLPGADERYDELRRTLEKSGIEVQKREGTRRYRSSSTFAFRTIRKQHAICCSVLDGLP